MNVQLKKKCKVMRTSTSTSNKVGIFADSQRMVANVNNRDIPRGMLFDINICLYRPAWVNDWIIVNNTRRQASTTDEGTLGLVIVASTDYILNSKGIPMVGDRFTQAYVREYNEGKEITEVMISYSDDINLQLRDNEAIITRVKETYSRAEITDALNILQFKGILTESQISQILNRL